jgi:DNA helicase-2/ATP-dependent DNA helicase PcrA
MLNKLSEEGETRLQNIGELRSDIARFAADFDSYDVLNDENSAADSDEIHESNPDGMAILDAFLESIALYTDTDKYEPGSDAVNLLTIHSAKGLEWNTVFLVGAEDGIFPSARSLNTPEDTEEERRLAYVAITRARERLFITHASERVVYGSTQRNPLSRFVREIDKACIEKRDDFTKARSAKVPGEAFTAASAYTLQSQLEDRHLGFGKIAITSANSNSNKNTGTEKEFSPGERIVHPKFGGGMVISAEAMGGDTLLEIAFDDVGTKKLMAKFAKLKKETT